MPAPERIVVEIEREAGEPAYRAVIHGLRTAALVRDGLKLSPTDTVPFSSGPVSLADLSRRLFPADSETVAEDLAFFNERHQLELGRFLGEQLFGSVAASNELRELFAREGQELRLVTDDEHLVRLPWVLLAAEELVLAARRRWSIALAREAGATTTLRPKPRILLARPEPAGLPPTQGREHSARLAERIGGGANPLYKWSEVTREANTWPAFAAALAELRPDIVYFYGHGDGDPACSALLFETAARDRDPITMDRVAQAISEQGGGAVKLAFLNCCSGDAGGLLGAGMQLRRSIPAVLANRTFAWSQVARASAEIFFEELLLQGAPPHAAYAAVCRGLFEPETPGTASSAPGKRRPISWMTPVLHLGYQQWESAPLRRKPSLPKKAASLAHFDRARQLGAVVPLAGKLREPAVREHHAVFWYGAQHQGVQAFHGHLRHELALPGHVVRSFRPFAWPPDLLAAEATSEGWNNEAEASILSALAEVFDVLEPNQIAQVLRAEHSGSARGERLVCYVAVPPPPEHLGGLEARLRLLHRFLALWDQRVAPCFEEPFVPVLGVSLEAQDPSGLRDELVSFEDALGLSALRFLPLPELGAVELDELASHLRSTASHLRATERDLAAREILRQTAGRYDDVVSLLADEQSLAQLLGQSPRAFPSSDSSADKEPRS